MTNKTEETEEEKWSGRRRFRRESEDRGVDTNALRRVGVEWGDEEVQGRESGKATYSATVPHRQYSYSSGSSSSSGGGGSGGTSPRIAPSRQHTIPRAGRLSALFESHLPPNNPRFVRVRSEGPLKKNRIVKKTAGFSIFHCIFGANFLFFWIFPN